MGNGGPGPSNQLLREGVVVILRVRYILSPQKLHERGEGAHHAVLLGPGHEQSSPDELMASDDNSKPKVERNLVSPGPHRKRHEEQAVPEGNDENVEPEYGFCDK